MINVIVRSGSKTIGQLSVEPDTGLVGRSMAEWEQSAISTTLKLTGGSRAATAKILKIGERTVYRKVEEYHLEHLCRTSENPAKFKKKE
jgi:two-component system response regulator HydG